MKTNDHKGENWGELDPDQPGVHHGNLVIATLQCHLRVSKFVSSLILLSNINGP